jgi:hypothetical protein
MNVGRVGFDAVELGDGSVLVVGDDHACIPGGAESGSERAEVYEPAIDRWVEIESLNKPRKIPATVALADGSAMVIGGVNADDVPFSSTKILSPATRTWTDGPLLTLARGQVAAAPLGDGRVLVASVVAQEETSQLVTTEIYDPSTRFWESGGEPLHVYMGSMMPLTDGRVLLIGYAFEWGVWLEIFDPSTETWTPIETPGDPPQSDGFGKSWNPQFVALADGGILAVGGFDDRTGVTARVALYDPRQNQWFDVEPMPTAKAEAALVRLDDGRVLVIGGYSGPHDPPNQKGLTAVEVFDPTTNGWTVTGDLLEPRYDAVALALRDGSVLLMGGAADFNVHGDTPWCPSAMTTVERFVAP